MMDVKGISSAIVYQLKALPPANHFVYVTLTCGRFRFEWTENRWEVIVSVFGCKKALNFIYYASEENLAAIMNELKEKIDSVPVNPMTEENKELITRLRTILDILEAGVARFVQMRQLFHCDFSIHLGESNKVLTEVARSIAKDPKSYVDMRSLSWSFKLELAMVEDEASLLKQFVALNGGSATIDSIGFKLFDGSVIRVGNELFMFSAATTDEIKEATTLR
jgi:hypothetical protein